MMMMIIVITMIIALIISNWTTTLTTTTTTTTTTTYISYNESTGITQAKFSVYKTHQNIRRILNFELNLYHKHLIFSFTLNKMAHSLSALESKYFL